MKYAEFTQAHGHDVVWVHVYRSGDVPVQMGRFKATDVVPSLIQSRLWLLRDVVRVTIEADCTCQYTITDEHHGISRACVDHVVDQVVGRARY